MIPESPSSTIVFILRLLRPFGAAAASNTQKLKYIKGFPAEIEEK